MNFKTIMEAHSDNPFEWGRELMMQMAKLEEKRIKDAIVGSKITDIEYNPIKNRKTMYELVIRTDAEKVPRLQFEQGHILHDARMGIVESNTHFFDLSEIRVRTKTRPPFQSCKER